MLQNQAFITINNDVSNENFHNCLPKDYFYPWIPYYGIVGLLKRINKVLWQITFPLCLLEIFFFVL